MVCQSLKNCITYILNLSKNGLRKIMDHFQRYCDHCNEYIAVQRKNISHLLHLFLSLITGGLWIIIWCRKYIQAGRYHCPKCGSPVYKFFTTKPVKNEKGQIIDPIYSPYLPISIIGLSILSIVIGLIRGEMQYLIFTFVTLPLGCLLFKGRKRA